MILLLLHRRGARTFGQTERETGMKQRLLTQVRIELVLSERVEYEGRGKGEKKHNRGSLEVWKNYDYPFFHSVLAPLAKQCDLLKEL